MDDLRTRIAAALLAHPDKWDGSCCGGQDFTSTDEWAGHVADVLIRELPELNRNPHNTGCVCDDCWPVTDE